MADQNQIYRIRFKVGEKTYFFVNAMSPTRALTDDPHQAQRFMSETSVAMISQQILDGRSRSTGPTQYFTVLKTRLLSLNPAVRASMHVDYARILSDGLAGVWSEMPKGGVFLNIPNQQIKHA
jgi:hypothetical protein